jgi:AraC-like DNA-binding protein
MDSAKPTARPNRPANAPPFTSFAASEADALAASLAPIVPGAEVSPLRGSTLRAQVTATSAADVGIFTTRFSNVHVTFPEERPFIGATIPLRGACRMAGNGTPLDVVPGRFHVVEGHKSFDAQMTDDACEFLAVTVGNDKLRSVRSLLGGEPSRQIDLREHVSLHHPGARRFTRQACNLWRELRHGMLPRSEIALQETIDRLVCSLVETSRSRGLDPREASMPDRVAGLAAEYIVENLDRPLTLSELAANTGTSVRTLTRAFRRRFGTSPQQFIRDRRLEAANRALLVTDAGDVTVTEIAMHFGFWHLGRFSTYYRTAFGESPSSTLGNEGTQLAF